MLVNANPRLRPIPCAIYRGGTSRVVIFRSGDVPASGEERDQFLLAVMGSPHLRQIDGLGGALPVTSKVAIVGRSDRSDCDVDYTFGQVLVERPVVDYTAVCGNASAAIGPFAIDSGLVPASSGTSTQVRIFNTNTARKFVAEVPTTEGAVDLAGDYAIDGVPGTGAKIFLDYRQAIGTHNGRLLPTGRSVDVIRLDDGRDIELSICDLAFPCVFVDARSLGLSGVERPDVLDGTPFMATVQQEIRGRAAVLMGAATDWTTIDETSPIKPMLCLVAPPVDTSTFDGRPITASQIDIHARGIALGRCHVAMAGSAALCLAVASRLSGTVVSRLLRNDDMAASALRIGHPSGQMEVEIDLSAGRDAVTVRRVGMGRTARAVMAGTVYLPCLL